jgi:hypothetical protein
MLLNDFPQADKRLAYLLGLTVQGPRGHGQSRRTVTLVILSAFGFLLFWLWTLR